MIQPKPYRFSVEAFDRMGRLGVWHEDARVELLDGEAFDMAPIGNRHVWTPIRLQRRFEEYRDRAILSVQNPLRLETSEPQPDLALLTPPLERYTDRLPEAEDVLLLIEVADASLSYDRDRKLPVYARAGVLEVWLVNLNAQQLEVYRHPQGERYRELRTYSEGEAASPLAFAGSVRWWA